MILILKKAMEGNYNNNDSENASYVTMPTTNQMMPPAALYSTEIPLVSMEKRHLMHVYTKDIIHRQVRCSI